jgi:hypothetical protein
MLVLAQLEPRYAGWTGRLSKAQQPADSRPFYLELCIMVATA